MTNVRQLPNDCGSLKQDLRHVARTRLLPPPPPVVRRRRATFFRRRP